MAKNEGDNDPLRLKASSTSAEDLDHCLGVQLRQVRTQLLLSQQQVAKKAGISSGQTISNYERGNHTPSPPVVVRLARALEQDPELWLLYTQLQLAVLDPESGPTRNAAIRHIRSLIGVLEEQRQTSRPEAFSGSRDLTQFPGSFSPLCVIVGDRREEHPKNRGDLFAFSASCVDDRWLASLHLPRDTEKITDKVFMFQDPEAEEWRRKTFGETNLLIIGSPAANLAAREFNRLFIHRFAVPSEAEKLWLKIKEEQFPSLKTPAALEQFKETNRDFMRSLMRRFQQPGFVTYDPQATENESAIRVVASIFTEYQQDFATVTVGKNPYARADAPFFSILAAGVHHPGTAWAVRFLSEPKRFENHPYGGVLEVHFPSKLHDPDTVKWYESVGLGDADWHTIGHSNLPYDHNSLCDAISRCLKAKIITDVPVNSEELEGHLELLAHLTSSKHLKDSQEKTANPA